MKLHLPSRLRKALLACIALLASHTLPVTVAAGSLASSGALVSFLMGQQAVAQEGDDDDEIMPLAYDGPTGITWGEKKDWAADSDGAMKLDGETMRVDVTGCNEDNKANFTGKVTNLRLDFNGTADSGDPKVALTGSIEADNIWFTGSNGRARIDSNTLLSTQTKNIYINNVQVWFTGADYTGDHALNTDFTIGSSCFTEGYAALDCSALRIGANVTTGGKLILVENAHVSFQGGKTFTVGSVDGAGYRLELTSYNNSANSFMLTGGGELGSISLDRTTTLKLGEGATLKILEDSEINGTLNGSPSANTAIIAKGTLSGSGGIIIDRSTTSVINALNMTGTLTLNSATVEITDGGTINTLKFDGYDSNNNTLRLGGDLTVTTISKTGTARHHYIENINKDSTVYLMLGKFATLQEVIGSDLYVIGENVGLGLNTTETGTLAAGIEFKGAFRLLGSGSLTLGADSILGSLTWGGSSIILGNHKLELGALNVNQKELSLSLEDGGYISGLTEMNFGADGSIVITLAGFQAIEDAVYQIFQGGKFDASWWDHITVVAEGMSDVLHIEYREDGSICIVSNEEHESFDWENKNNLTSALWGKAHWIEDTAYLNDGTEDVSFGSSVAVDVTLTGDDKVVRAHNMLVNDAQYTFSGDGYSIEVQNLRLDTTAGDPKASLVFNVGVKVTESLTGGGSITMNKSALNLAGNNMLAGGVAITLLNGSSLTLNGDAVLKGIIVGADGSAADSAKITLGGNLTLSRLALLSGSSISFELAKAARAIQDTVWVDLGADTDTLDLSKASFDSGIGIKKSGNTQTTLVVDGLTGDIHTPFLVTEGTLKIDGAGDQSLTFTGDVTVQGGTLFFDCSTDTDERYNTYTFDGGLTIAEGAALTVNRDVLIFGADTVVNGALTLDWEGEIHMRGDILLGSNASVTVNDGCKIRLADGTKEAYIVFSHVNATNGNYGRLGGGACSEVTSDAFNSLISHVDDGVGWAFGSGVVFGVNNSGATFERNIRIDAGAQLAFIRAGSSTLNGKLSGAGTLEVATEKEAGNERWLTLNRGGSIGTLLFNRWGGGLALGADFTANALTAAGAPADNRQYVIKSVDGANAKFILNTTANASAQKIQFLEGLTLVKQGSATQTLENSTIEADVQIKDGILALTGKDTSVTGAITIDNAALDVAADLTINASSITISGGIAGGDANTANRGLVLASGSTVNCDITLDGGYIVLNKQNASATINGTVSVTDNSRLNVWYANTTLTLGGLEVSSGKELTIDIGNNHGSLSTVNVNDKVSLDGKITVNNSNLVLKAGGRLNSSGNIVTAWGGRLTIGGDLEVAGALNADVYATDEKSEVYVLFENTSETTSKLDDFINKGNRLKNDNIGLGKTGFGKLTLTDGGKVERNFKVAQGTLALSANTEFTKALAIAEGATLDIGSSTLTVANIAGAGTIAVSDGGKISGLSGFDGSLTLSLSGFSLDTLTTGKGYELFINGSDYDSLWKSLTVTFADFVDIGNYEIICEGAYIRLKATENPSTLHWVSTDGVWKEDDTLDWASTANGEAKYSYKSAEDWNKLMVFDKNDTHQEVTLEGTIGPGGVTVLGNYTFFIGKDDYFVIGEQGLSVAEGASLTLHNDENSTGFFGCSGDINLSGSLTIEGFTEAGVTGDLKVGADAKLTLNGTTLNVQDFSLNGHKLTVTGDGSLTTTADNKTVSITDGTLSLGEEKGASFTWNDSLTLAGGLLEVHGNSSVTGNIDMSNGSSISLYDNATITSVSGKGDILVGSGTFTAKLTDGGKIDGALKFNEWGGTLQLGKDLEISTFSAANNLEADRTRTITADSDVTLTTTGSMEQNDIAYKITTGEHVTLNVSKGRLNLNGATFEGNVIVGEKAILKADNSNYKGKSVELKSGSVFALWNSSVAAELSGDGALMVMDRVTLTGGGSVGILAIASWDNRNLTIDGCDFTFTNVAQGNPSYVLNDGAATGNISLTNKGSLILNETNWTNVASSQVTLNISGAGDDGGTVKMEADQDWELGTTDKVKITNTNLAFDKTGEGKLTVDNKMISDWKSVTVSKGTLAITGDAAAIKELTLNGTLALGTGTSVTGLESLTLGKDATLAVSELDEKEARIFGKVEDLKGTLTLDISAWKELDALLAGGKEEFALFSGFDCEGLTLNIVGWTNEDWDYELDGQGNLVFKNIALAPDTLYWATNADGTWSADSTRDWAAADGESASFRFATGRDVVFGAQGGNKTVKVEGGVIVNNMTVSAAYTFNAGADGSITVNEDLTTNAGGGVATFSVDTTVKGGMTHNGGTVKITDNHTFTVEGDLVSNSGTVMVTGNSTLRVDGDVKLTASNISYAFGDPNANPKSQGTSIIGGVLNFVDGSWLSVNETHTMTIKGTGDSHVGIMNGLGTGTFNLAGNLTIEDLRQGGSVTFNRYEESTNDTVTVSINGSKNTNGAGKTLTFTKGVNVVFGDGLFPVTGNNVAAYTGTLTVEDNATFTKTTGNGVAINLGAAGKITVAGEMNVTGNVTSAGAISAGTLKADGSTITLNAGSLTVTDGSIGTLSGTGASLTVNEGGKLAIANMTAGLTSLTVSTGATLAIANTSAELTDLKLNGTLKLGTGKDGKNQLKVKGLTLGDGATLAIDETGLSEVKEGVVSTALIAFTGGSFEPQGKLTLDFSGWTDLELDGEQDEYRFALFSGLDFGEKNWEDFLELKGVEIASGCKVTYEDGDLVFSFMNYEKKWVWDGKEGATWADDSDGNWTQNDGTPEKKDVYFTEEGAQNGGGLVTIAEAGVNPNAVYVHGGSYTFEGEGKGLNVVEGIVIGGWGNEAELELKLANTSVPKVTLDDKGTLTVSHEEALQTGGDNATEILFKGGTLAYGKTAEGEYVQADLSALVSEKSSGIIRIRVGETELAAAALDDASAVTWGSATATTANEGIRRALMVGLEKTGTDALVVEWAAQKGETYAAKTSALEGTLAFVMHADKDVAATLGREVTLAGGATVEYTAEGSGTMQIADSYVGVDGETGKVVIGAAVADTAKYELSGDRSGFGGTLELRGDSEGASVSVASAAALGGKGTSLVLNGRAVNLATGGTVSAASIEVMDGTVNKLSGAAAVLSTGSLTGAGVLAADGQHSIESNDIAGFGGMLVAGDAASWTLRGDSVGGDGSFGAALAGDGTIAFNYAEAVTLTGAVGDDTYGAGTSLQNTGAGELVIRIAEENALSSGALITSATAGAIRLGDAGGEGYWAGTEIQGDGTLVLSSGGLINGISSKGKAKLNVETVADGTVDAGGTNGGLLDSIYLDANSKLTGVTGDIVVGAGKSSLTLRFGASNVSGSANGGESMIETTGKVTVNDLGDKSAPVFRLDFSADGLMNTLKTLIDTDGSAYLHVTNGTLELDEALWLWVQGAETQGGAMRLLRLLGVQIEAVEGGDIHLVGAVNDVYFVLGEDDPNNMEHEVTGYGTLDKYKATVVGEGETLTLTLTGAVDAADSGATTREKKLGGGVINNLVGMEDSELHLVNGGDDPAQNRVTVVLNNEGEVEHLLPEEGRGIDTEFLGTIVGEEGVDIVKAGAGTLTVGSSGSGKGGLDVEGSLTLAQGGITVEGYRAGDGEDEPAGNEVGSLAFAYDTAAVAGEQRGFTFRNGTTTTHGIEENSDDAYAGDHLIRLEKAGELVFAGEEDETTLSSTRFVGDGSGTLTVTAGELALEGAGDAPRIAKVHVNLSDAGLLSLTDGAAMTDGSVTAANGGALALDEAAAISGTVDITVADGGSVSLSNGSSIATKGTVEVQEGGSMTLNTNSWLRANRGAVIDGTLDLTTTQESVIWGLQGTGTIDGIEAGLELQGEENAFAGSLEGSGTLRVSRGAALTLDNVGGDGRWNVRNDGKLTVDATAGGTTRLGELHLGVGTATTLLLDTDKKSAGALDLSSLTWDAGAEFTIESTGANHFTGSSIDLGMVGTLQEGAGPDLRLKGTAFLHYEAGDLMRDAEGHLRVGLVMQRNNLFRLPNMSKNELAGADMLWNASSPNSANWIRLTSNFDMLIRSDLYRMVDSLAAKVQSGNTAGVGRALAAGAGASLSVLGSALSQDVQRQLTAIRNRTTTITPEPRYEGYDELPFYHVWVNGEGSFHKLDADGTAPGYSLNSWGGTLGVDADLSRHTTVGVAMSAMYGNLSPDAPDSAKGDLDTYYLSAFARVADGSWLHTFVMSGGVADVSMRRTVNYGDGSYATKGNTHGYALAAMYELGYSQVLDAEGATVLQSVVNVAYRHANINAFTESGSDAALEVGRISHDVLTVGAGARMQAALAQNAFNRTAVLEARALIKADAGDRSGKVGNRYRLGDGTVRELESAKVGAVGLEMGVGLTIPLGSEEGTIFMDASVELRRGYTAIDANVGYRYSF